MPRKANGGAGRPSAEQAALKRQAILEAAQEEFVQSGFRGASMRRIAERAQVSTRTLYNQYADKLALFAACLEYGSEAIELDLKETSGTLRERLLAHATNLQHQMGNDSATKVARLLYREGLEFDELRQMARQQFLARQVQPVARILTEYMEKPAGAEELASHFVALVLAKWQRSVIFNDPLPGKRAAHQHALAVTDLFLSGVGNQFRT